MGLAINLVHILVTGPLLVYAGLVEEKPRWLFDVLLVLGIVLAAYFPYVMYTTKLSQYHVWLAIHLFIIVGLMVTAGIMRDNTPRIIFSLLLAIGIAAIGYHVIRAYQSLSSASS